MATGAFVCTQCAEEVTSSECALHLDDVALSLADSDLVEELGRIDVEAWEKYAHKYELIGFAVASSRGILGGTPPDASAWTLF